PFPFSVTVGTVSLPLSLPDALPIYGKRQREAIIGLEPRPFLLVALALADLDGLDDPQEALRSGLLLQAGGTQQVDESAGAAIHRSEEHTSELQSRENLVCRLLLEKK